MTEILDITEPPKLVPAPKFKLYFTGESLAGGEHACGRSSPPTLFRSWGEDSQDKRPHAFVTQAFGDHLMANDRAPGAPVRYEWAEREPVKVGKK